MSERLRVFLDSNVLISALIGHPDSPPVILVDWLAGGQLGELVTSQCNIDEVERNLTRKLPEAIPIWNEFLKRTGIGTVPCRQRSVKGINPKDSAIVASAIAVRASHFVTGDKKLLVELAKRQRVSFAAVNPREMLDVILSVSRG